MLACTHLESLTCRVLPSTAFGRISLYAEQGRHARHLSKLGCLWVLLPQRYSPSSLSCLCASVHARRPGFEISGCHCICPAAALPLASQLRPHRR